MKPKSIAIVGAAETTKLGVIPDMSQIQLHADAALERDGRCRPKARRHRRHRHRRRDPDHDRALSRADPEMGRRHRGRRLLVYDPHPPCRGGDRLGPVRDRADHPWRERPLRRRAHPQHRGADQPRRPVRAALWADGAALVVHDSRVALHEDLRPDRRDPGDGLGRAARMGGQEPARHLQGRRSRSKTC